MAPGRTLLLLLMLCSLGLASAQEDPAQEGDEGQVYFLDREDESDGYNVTTYPPGGSDPGTAIQFTSIGAEARLSWSIAKLPAPWNITRGAPSHATIWLSGLDEVFPTPPDDPQQALASAGRLRITTVVLDYEQNPLIQGQVLFEPQPLQPRDTVFELAIPMEAVADVTLDPSDATSGVTLRILVSGRNLTQTNVSPVHVHVGAPDTPSGVSLAGFPIDGFRAWEDTERAAEEKNRGILTGRDRNTTGPPAPTASPSPSPDLVEESPVGTALLIALVVVASVAASALREAELPHRRR